MFGSFFAATTAARIPLVRTINDKLVTEVLKQRLASYGKPEFTTDSTKYTPVGRVQPAAT